MTSPAEPIEANGFVAPGFEAVAEAFEANFRDGGEVGAAFCVFRHGEPVVNLWAGRRTPGGADWTQDTLVNVFSTTKVLTAVALAVLADRGQLDYAAPVARYWLEFAQAGKDAVTVAQLVSHQAGLVGFEEPTTIEDLYDWDRICARLARQAPRWTPGEQNGYHAITFGYLAGEVVRRVTGQSVGAFVQDQVAGPLGADFFIRLPASEDARVAPIIDAPPMDFDVNLLPPDVRAMVTNPEIPLTTANTTAWRRAEIPAAAGHGSAKGVARLYAALANGGQALLRPEAIERLREEQTGRVDVCLGVAPGWGLGVMLNRLGSFGPNPRAFGHPGRGGSFGCADPEAGLAMGYVMNQLGLGALADPRGMALVQAVYACAA
ncbi:MAG: serine hydrolase domain-containing protein [Phenylobacterium sp.]